MRDEFVLRPGVEQRLAWIKGVGGEFDRVELLAAASDADTPCVFKAGEVTHEFTVQRWRGYVGQWDNRIWRTTTTQVAPPANAAPGTPPTTRTNPFGEMIGLTPAFVKTAPALRGP